MKVPEFKYKKLRDDVRTLVDKAPYRVVYEIVLDVINRAMDELLEIRQTIPENEDNRTTLKEYDRHYSEFGERDVQYYQSFLDAEDRSAVDKPLFDGDYSGYAFEGPGWPDIETPWRLANELATAAAEGGASQGELDEIGDSFRGIAKDFWTESVQKLLLTKNKIEGQTGEADPNLGPARRYGFWPVVVGAVGALSAAAGYAASRSDDPGSYVGSAPPTQLDKTKATAKNVGIGFVVGAAAATLLILRVRVDR